MLVVSALLAFNALLLWVATGPRSLAVITPYIESALSSSDGRYGVKIGETTLIWDGWKHPVDIRLKNVTVLTGEGQIFTRFPEIALGVDVLYLPLGRIMPTSLAISAPRMNLVQNDDRSFGFGFKQEGLVSADTTESVEASATPTVPFSVLLAPFLSQNEESNFRRLRTIIVRDAGLHVSNSKQIVFFDAKDFNFTLNRDRRGEIKINSSANIYYKDYSSNIRSEFSFKPHNTTVEGMVEFSELMPSVLAGLFSDNLDLKSFAVPVGGKVNLSLGLDGDVQYLDFDINGGKGSMVSDRLVAALPISSLHFRGSLGNNLKEMKLKSLAVDMDGMQLLASGSANFFDMVAEPSATPEIKADISLKDVPSDKVGILWPKSLSPMTREWVTGNISGGKISEAKLALDFKKGDLNADLLPKAAVDASIDMNDIKVRYLPEHPPATHVLGKVHIDGRSLTADIESADYLEKTKLSNGHVLIDDLNADNPYIKVDMQVDAPAKDMVHFLGLPRLKHAERLGLHEAAVVGSVKGKANVGFNFFAPKGMKAEDAIIYDVKADVAGISQNNFLHKFDIVGANGTVSVDNKGVEFVGSSEVNGASVSNGKVKYLFTPEKGIDTFMEFTATAGMDDIKRFGYPDFPFMKGVIGVNAKVKLGDKIEQTGALLNLTDTEINLGDISWKKPRGESVTLELASEKKASVLKINSFTLSGKKISAKGSATLSDNFSEIANAQLSNFSLGDSSVSNLNYEKNADGIKIDVTASSVDLTGAMEKSDSNFSFANFPAIQLKASIDKLTLGKDRKISDFSGDLLCDKAICQNANLLGKTGAQKPFTFKIFRDAKSQRQLSVHSDDAGSFLLVLGVLEGMKGGVLTINGSYIDDGSNSKLVGKFDVGEHNIKNAPLLGKILSLASLTGFFDALVGNGIHFKELSIPFTLHNDVLALEKGKTFGSAIGMTVDGTITFPKKTMDLQGTVVPSYTLNSVLGKVPLFGDMLIGGEGQGIFAARYSIKGLEKDANVSVNPLSILTPGFLRGLFDIFDKPVKK